MAQAAVTAPRGAMQMRTTEAAMHRGRVMRCSQPRRRGLRTPKASTGVDRGCRGSGVRRADARVADGLGDVGPSGDRCSGEAIVVLMVP